MEGGKHSEATKLKMRGRCGKKSPWFGKKHSEASRLKMSEVRKGRFSGENNPYYGKKHTLKIRRKIKKSLKGIVRPSGFYKRISLLGIQKQQNSKEPTSIEKIVYDFLKAKGIIFEKQRLINNKFLVDVYIPDLNLVIECDGDYWHSLERVKKKDKAENAYLTKCGYNLTRLSEEEINNRSFINKLEV